MKSYSTSLDSFCEYWSYIFITYFSCLNFPTASDHGLDQASCVPSMSPASSALTCLRFVSGRPFIHCFTHPTIQQAASILSAQARIYHHPLIYTRSESYAPACSCLPKAGPPNKSRRHRNPARRKGAGACSSRLSTATARPVRFLVWIFRPPVPPVPLPRYLGRHLWGPGLMMIALGMGIWAPPVV